jgi:hypothetical protein
MGELFQHDAVARAPDRTDAHAAKRCASYGGSRSAAVFLPGQVVGEKGELPIVLDGGQRQV